MLRSFPELMPEERLLAILVITFVVWAVWDIVKGNPPL